MILKSLVFSILVLNFVFGGLVSLSEHNKNIIIQDLGLPQILLEEKQETNINNSRVVDSDTVSRIKKDGYIVEEHIVQTADGYILTMHRIPSLNSTKPPIFLQHGVLASSSDWILTGPGKGLAYILSDAGYDVWMGNNRGNKYSRKHAWLDPDSKAYWNFSWNEIGLHDVSSMIDYVLSKTGKSKLQYIGHSQGTTVFFVLASNRPEYNDKILSMHAMAPVAFMENAQSPILRVLAPILGNGNALVELLGSAEFLPSTALLNKLGYLLCKDNSPIQELCANIIFLICGYDTHNLNRTMIPDIVATIPSGASVNQMLHFAQIYKSEKFRMFDYGLIRNKIEYGTFKPPEYNLSKISAPVALYYGDNDWLSAVEDVKRLGASLGNMQISYRVQHEHWNHLDYLWAINVKQDLFDKMIKDLEYFQNN